MVIGMADIKTGVEGAEIQKTAAGTGKRRKGGVKTAGSGSAGLIKTHSELYALSSGSGGGGGTYSRVNFNSMAISDIRKFLSADPVKVNKYNMYHQMMVIDPEIRAAIKMISYIVSNSYLGPGYKSIMDVARESAYIPESEDSLKIFQNFLSEIQFRRWLPIIVRGLIRDGNVYLRVHRDQNGKIISLELLPASVVTVIDKNWFIKKDGVIRGRDYYIVNEDMINLTIIDPDKQPDISAIDERIIPASDVLHFGLDWEDSMQKDIRGRNTLGVYGNSPLESLIFVVKMKLALMLDYMLYSRTGLPRWDFTIDLTNVMNLQNYIGDYYSRLREARSLAQEIFREFESQLYYIDTDPGSPTYGELLPTEADHMFIHGSDVSVEQKGGIPASSQFLEVIKKCDMCICSVLGVPLSMFGYESGSTYAVSYITKSFMLSLGAGMLKEIELTLKDFMLSELQRRGIQISLTDLDHMELKFVVDDSDVVKQRIDLEKAQMAIAIQSFVNGILTLNEARKRLGYDPVENGDLIRVLEGVTPLSEISAAVAAGGGVVPGEGGVEEMATGGEGAHIGIVEEEEIEEVAPVQGEIPVKKIQNDTQEMPVEQAPVAQEDVKKSPATKGKKKVAKGTSSELPGAEPAAEIDVAKAYAEALDQFIESLIDQAAEGED